MKIVMLGIVWMVALTILFGMTVELAKMVSKPTQVLYDCRLAEISPDYPLEVKTECRELLRAGMI
jgi:hypothetical protein